MAAETTTSTPADPTTTAPADPSTTEPVDEPTATAGQHRLTCWTAPPGEGDEQLTLVDVTADTGLVEPLTGMHGHAAIWTDIEGDGYPDLYVGTFANRPPAAYQERGADGPAPDRLLANSGEKFEQVTTIPNTLSRTSGGVSADLDGDGDLDLVVSRNIKSGSGLVETEILNNEAGTYTALDNSRIPGELGGRSVAAFDYDQDGLLDLFIVEDRYTGGSSVLLRNEAGSSFTAVRDAGIPDDVFGLGVSVGDFNEDRMADIFVSGSNRLFLSTSPGSFEEADNDVFAWDVFGNEDDVAGSSVGDVNNDGHLDLLVGHHYNSTVDFGEEVAVRLYLGNGTGEFEDVTETAGLTPLPTKAPHVEIQDLNNDGLADIITSASAGNGPAVFMSRGIEGGVPRFETPAELGAHQYWVAAPTADYDRDGRLDVFLVEWEPSLPSLLLRNETRSGNWIEVSVDASLGHGLGWTLQLETPDGVVRSNAISATQGYSAGVLPYVHFGLGDADEATIRIIPPDGDTHELSGVRANQHLRWPEGCG